MTIAQLHSFFLSSNAACTDTRKINRDDMFFALKGDNFNGNTYAEQAIEMGAKYAIIDEPEYHTTAKTILVKNVLETLQELATYHRLYLNKPIIALTGSNGKTTTKELINVVLSKKYNTSATIGNLNNHIGVPLTLLAMRKETEIGIVEMGANHLKEIAFLCDIAKPDYGYITNFGKAHLEGFGGVEGVIKGKSEMYAFLLQNKKTIFINSDDAIQIEKTKKGNIYSFGNLETNPNVPITNLKTQPNVTCTYNNLKISSQLIGDYNFHNIAAAICIGNFFKVDDESIKAAIENYVSTNNRSQIITKGSNQIVLDAYNANPTSMRAALLNFQNLKGNKIAILGDMFELGVDAKQEHQDIVDLVLSLNIDQVFLIGEHFYESKIDANKAIQFKTFDNFETSSELKAIQNSSLLIKGSRGMALERVLDMY
ncbi:UDP-N-acetylmuramoyl-tripeptide--D-alanyl-D-alanine ligase [Algibacter mikhailovii]|nr:UDP-N-acetylmuramoyl-tripeptide--D-alanyl-D-alanine ligase [Algibacter mikhailovii]